MSSIVPITETITALLRSI